MAVKIVCSPLPLGRLKLIDLYAGTVLLHLFAAVLYARHTSLPTSIPPFHPPLPSPGPSHDSRPNGHSSPVSTALSAPINGPNHPPPPLPISCVQPPSSSTHHIRHSSMPYPYPPIRSIYITAPNPFRALESFVLSSAETYGLDLYRFGGGMKAALSQYLGCGGGRGVRAVLVGTRRGDPNGGELESTSDNPVITRWAC
jgi:FAD synthetase